MNEKVARSALTGCAALLVALATGCASVEFSSPDKLENVTVKGVPGFERGQHVAISTSGYYMFWTIPLFSGDLRWDQSKRSISGGTAFFQDQVGYAELQGALQKIAENRNCDLAEVYFNDTDSFYAGASYGGIIGALFGSSHMSISAILVPRETKVNQ